MAPMRVLHVEDTDGFTELLDVALEERTEGHEIIRAKDGREGLETLERREVDCIISDYEMPRLNGLELLAAVREEYPDLPFIMLTLSHQPHLNTRARQVGVSEFYQKQAGYDVFMQVVDDLVRHVEHHQAVHGTAGECTPLD